MDSIQKAMLELEPKFTPHYVNMEELTFDEMFKSMNKERIHKLKSASAWKHRTLDETAKYSYKMMKHEDKKIFYKQIEWRFNQILNHMNKLNDTISLKLAKFVQDYHNRPPSVKLLTKSEQINFKVKDVPICLNININY